MIQAPPTTIPVAFFDTECYPNYWLLKIRPQGGAVLSFFLRTGQRFSEDVIRRIASLFCIFTVISFNGIHYDVTMIAAALSGWTCEQLKWLNDQIIIEKRKPWDFTDLSWRPTDHIDLIEVTPGTGSQKQYAGRIHCKTMRDLPYEPTEPLSEAQIEQVFIYCDNDLAVLESLYDALQPQLHQRIELSKRYGIDLRSKSDAQLAESVLKHRCEQALGQRIYKLEIDWNLKFRYEPPAFLSFQSEQLKNAFESIKSAVFCLGPTGSVIMPKELEGLEISIGSSVYRLGIGGLHSQEKSIAHHSDESVILQDADVASYYPNLILNSGKFPSALGSMFLKEYSLIKDERLAAKDIEKRLKKAGDVTSAEYAAAHVGNEGGKIMINGTFGKTGSPWSILFAPEMLIQTTVTGQLSLLMLIEWHEMQEISIVSANTDGIIIKCPRSKLAVSDSIIKYWEQQTGLQMEKTEYAAIYSRDINNYFAVKADGSGVKRKGEYSKAGLSEKKNPDVEICSDAVAKFLQDGTPILYTICACRDIRKFITIQKVAGGAVKMWGEGPRKGMKIRDMTTTLEANGWVRAGRKWRKPARWVGETDAQTAYESCFNPQRSEYLGKVIRWYYSTEAPGPIVYKTSGNTVSLSYGAKPCMVLPDDFPSDIDYDWYLQKSESILADVGYYSNETGMSSKN